MTIIIAIVLNIILLNIWLRFSNNIMHVFKYNKTVIGYSIYFGATGAGAIYMYPRILEYINMLNLSFTTTANTTTIALFGLYLLLRTSLFIRIRQKSIIKTSLKMLLYFIVILTLGIILNMVFKTQGREITAGFFLIMATAEEWVKRIASYKSFKKYHITYSDMILFAILIALGFSFRENILLALDGSNSLLRIPMYLVHSIFSAVIAYAIYRGEKKPRHEQRTVIGITLAIWGHARYNLTSNKTSIITSIIVIIIVYYLATLLLYKSDSIYLSKN